MFKNYILIALRNLFRHKEYTLINTIGLSIGLAASFLILLFIQHELSYDRYHENADNIYRLTSVINMQGKIDNFAPSPVPVAPAMKADIPGIVNYARVGPAGRKLTVSYGDIKFFEEGIVNVDSTFFEIFTYKFIEGNPKQALKGPYMVVITDKIARKYFGSQKAVGKVIRIDNQRNFTVSGVVKEAPSNSHIQFDIFVSFSTLRDILGEQYFQAWINFSTFTYLKLNKNTSPEAVEARFTKFIDKYYAQFKQQFGVNLKFNLQPVKDIHLYSHFQYEISPNSDISYIYIMAAIALFLLAIASINFMNLATARYANRAKEVGIRKVLGAYRSQLIQQFIGESVFITFCSFIISLVLIEIALPFYGDVIGRKLNIDFYNNAMLFGGLIFITLIVGVVSGSYPAFFLSRFTPQQVLKGTLKTGAKSSTMRKTLVVVQFTLSIILLVGTGMVNRQLSYLEDKDLGLNKEGVMIVPIHETMYIKKDSFKNELLKNPNILAVTATTSMPGRILNKRACRPEGYQENQIFPIFEYMVDYNFIDVMKIKILKGRNFSKDMATDTTAYILNQAAVKKLGWKDPIGKDFEMLGNSKGKVIGVVMDFHFISPKEQIEPLAISMPNTILPLMVVKINGRDVQGTVKYVEQKFKEFDNSRPFDYSFFDTEYKNLFLQEEKLSDVLMYFAFFAILIACLGLYGLSSFITEQRTKEIGIRKVMGASVVNILMLLSKEYIKLVALSTLLAWLIAYYVMDKWLQNFAYRVNIDPGTFILAAFIALLIALLTVSYQAVKAALANPVYSLKYE